MTTVSEQPDTPTDTRERLLKVAADLFIEHSFAGTSHKMIADAVGITKAAVHYHFRTREELLIAVMEPFHAARLEVLQQVEDMRSPRKQAVAVIAGYANVVCQNPRLAAVLTHDPSVIRAVQNHPVWGPIVRREAEMLARVNDGPSGVMRAYAVLTGLPGAAGVAPESMTREELRADLTDLGHRILGLRRT